MDGQRIWFYLCENILIPVDFNFNYDYVKLKSTIQTEYNRKVKVLITHVVIRRLQKTSDLLDTPLEILMIFYIRRHLNGMTPRERGILKVLFKNSVKFHLKCQKYCKKLAHIRLWLQKLSRWKLKHPIPSKMWRLKLKMKKKFQQISSKSLIVLQVHIEQSNIIH